MGWFLLPPVRSPRTAQATASVNSNPVIDAPV